MAVPGKTGIRPIGISGRKSLAAARQSPKYRFAVNLNFTGWRTVWVCFEEDAKVKGYKGSDDLQALVIFPQNTQQNDGQLFIDHLTLLKFVSNKRSSDLQFENKNATCVRPTGMKY